MGLTKIMKENWLSEKLTSRLFPPSETFSVILIPPRNFYFYLIQFVMPILLAWSVRLKSYEGPLAPFRMISFYGFVQRRSVEMAQGWLYLIQIFFQWFYRSQKREKRFYLTVKIKYIVRNLLPPPPPPEWSHDYFWKSRYFIRICCEAHARFRIGQFRESLSQLILGIFSLHLLAKTRKFITSLEK